MLDTRMSTLGHVVTPNLSQEKVLALETLQSIHNLPSIPPPPLPPLSDVILLVE